MKHLFTPNRFAVVITAVWVIGAGIALSRVTPDEMPTKLNEWGDFMAGVFAPIAFVWLVTAVWIQSAELREQRTELQLTREEFVHQREVMKAQADEARKQAEYIGTQTRILEDEEKRRKWADLDDLFRAEVNKLVGLIWLHESPFNFTHEGAHVINVSAPDSVEDFEFVARIAAQLTSQYAGNGVAKINTPITMNNPDRFDIVVAAVKSCQAKERQASPVMQVRAAALRLAEIVEYAELLKARASQRKPDD
ncbi:hypothetical protein IHQ71_28435 [Rhizobium sp. TH2]|uniref:hypothetical protein n=1 Tax=Rhizobium sp. TH2 TaxID=2775403 RepID=UPI002157C72D|nr:hypothetical protein [Rhizobium sp. TH2]UVC08992.1 hypothetical protein IHQ71_28435 [Rhizobium sp. TH2]